LSEKKIDMGHARALVSLSAQSQKIYAEKVVSQSLSVRDIEKLVNEKGNSSAKKNVKTNKDPQISEIENQLKEKLGVSIDISHSKSKNTGKITLKYSNLEVLEGLFKKLGYKK
jgi:ParB family chromosome partitioning protein